MKLFKKLAAAALAGVLAVTMLTGCDLAFKPLAPGMTDKTKAQQMLDLVNEVRRENGVAEVQLSEDASDALAAYAEAYAEWNYTAESRADETMLARRELEEARAESIINGTAGSEGIKINGKAVKVISKCGYTTDDPDRVKYWMNEIPSNKESLYKGQFANASYAAISTSDAGEGWTVIWLLQVTGK